jgi:BirA family transcriptional regulator, biotin operon repressor / biotin---[acetyl-CoA-carboxylase] ligase
MNKKAPVPAEPVLQALKVAADPVSGEVLAARLGLSRAGVWKRIQRLKSLGYIIDGSPRRGYLLREVPDKLLPDEVAQGLKAQLFKGPVHHHETLGSTNDLAKELGSQGAPEGTVVVAETQTRGRGRLGRDWNSPPGVGLYVSLLLRPELPPEELPQITLTAAVAAVKAVQAVCGLTPGIKWPNDLLWEGKKLGGILTEMETESDCIRHLVVGLGVNVNNRDFPPEIAATATSLSLASCGPVSRLHLLQAYLEEFEALYHRFLNREFNAILSQWKEFAVTLGRVVTVRQGLKEITGLALEVAPDGALLIETRPGEVVRVTSGEIVL